jgi:hypothetical protein
MHCQQGTVCLALYFSQLGAALQAAMLLLLLLLLLLCLLHKLMVGRHKL